MKIRNLRIWKIKLKVEVDITKMNFAEVEIKIWSGYYKDELKFKLKSEVEITKMTLAEI